MENVYSVVCFRNGEIETTGFEKPMSVEEAIEMIKVEKNDLFQLLSKDGLVLGSGTKGAVKLNKTASH